MMHRVRALARVDRQPVAATVEAQPGQLRAVALGQARDRLPALAERVPVRDLLQVAEAVEARLAQLRAVAQELAREREAQENNIVCFG